MAKRTSCGSCNSSLSDKGVHTIGRNGEPRSLRMGICEHCIACPYEDSDHKVTVLRKDELMVVVQGDDELIVLLKDWGYK